jgi:hypothetical protein
VPHQFSNIHTQQATQSSLDQHKQQSSHQASQLHYYQLDSHPHQSQSLLNITINQFHQQSFYHQSSQHHQFWFQFKKFHQLLEQSFIYQAQLKLLFHHNQFQVILKSFSSQHTQHSQHSNHQLQFISNMFHQVLAYHHSSCYQQAQFWSQLAQFQTTLTQSSIYHQQH